MIWFFYYVSMYLMSAGIRLSALWNPKAKLWVRGRKKWVKTIRSLPEKKNTRLWFHVSSLGEFEQARPVIEKLKTTDPAIEIILTFFSPSGYGIKVDYPLANILYLPEDLPGHAKKWVSIVQPDTAIFVKYDLWPGYLSALQRKHIPTILISAHWKPGTLFHSSTLPPTRLLLKSLDRIFLQQGEHLEFFRRKGFHNIDVAGDTRIDRSLELPGEVESRLPQNIRDLADFDIVAGSTWPGDEKILLSVASSLGLRMAIAPHDISEQNISRLMKQINVPAERYSALTHTRLDVQILVIDSIGLLNVLYHKGKMAYIGGGFGAGIHNTLEAAAHSKAVLFGPRYEKFPEAVDLITQKGAWSIQNTEELLAVVSDLLDNGRYQMAGKKAFNYLVGHRGASEKVTQFILETIGQKKEK